jgi:hypothetical protein
LFWCICQQRGGICRLNPCHIAHNIMAEAERGLARASGRIVASNVGDVFAALIGVEGGGLVRWDLLHSPSTRLNGLSILGTAFASLPCWTGRVNGYQARTKTVSRARTRRQGTTRGTNRSLLCFVCGCRVYQGRKRADHAVSLASRILERLQESL